ncbi:cell envelope-related transcriptional attenuator [Catenulispora acidiphila DSM 44928]|uniref:Cell envelope-related transcriptional attenuator n=1 Tax=Catenulispora acidiphila (strain DSM 44928 / JCM 14897 / NBRC 102108 / NRRL B-24433 / ID139908) TaxID=479433 RepID=C7QCI0_CATAD|nr:LCP family protein [Catenulispora acidiphila]ACU76443.1 cell envelope-related transcriptional attenuator [Catenulispora acidiphila DSM 44928]
MDDQTQRPRRRTGPDSGSMSRRRVVIICAASLAVLAVAGTTGLWTMYTRLNDNIRTVDIHADDAPGPADTMKPQPGSPSSSARASMNVLLIGSDDRDGANAQYGDANSGARSDTTMLLHVAADRKSATVASIPRDSMVQTPACTKSDGTQSQPQFGMFNAAFSIGGAACTVKTVETLSGLTVDHVLVVDFTGFKKIIDAIGGVPVHLDQAIDDPDSHLNLPAGTTVVDGEQALAFVRARHNLGNGSDIGRMSRQQVFLNDALDTITANGTLDDPAKLYKVLDAATKALTTDPALGSLPALADFASDVKQVPRQQITYLTVPWQWYQPDPNRVQLAPLAQELFTAMLQDTPVPAEVLALAAKQGEQVTPEDGSPNGAPGS